MNARWPLLAVVTVGSSTGGVRAVTGSAAHRAPWLLVGFGEHFTAPRSAGPALWVVGASLVVI